VLLESFAGALEEMRSITPASINWVIGKRHVFLSEGALQHLEILRNAKRNYSAVLIQSTWKGWYCRKKLSMIKASLIHQKKGIKLMSSPATGVNCSSSISPNLIKSIGNAPSSHIVHKSSLGTIHRPRPQPINGTPPPDVCDQKMISQTRFLLKFDFVRKEFQFSCWLYWIKQKIDYQLMLNFCLKGTSSSCTSE